jgi:hypothetical protein
MLLGLGRGPPGRGPPSPGPPGPGRPVTRGAPGRGPPAAPGAPGLAVAALWPGAGGPARPAGPAGPLWPGRGAAPRGADPIPVGVELNGLLPGRGPGRGPPRPGAGLGVPAVASGLVPGWLSRPGGALGGVCGPAFGCAGGNGACGTAEVTRSPAPSARGCASGAAASLAGLAGACAAGDAGPASPCSAAAGPAGPAGSACATGTAAAGPAPLAARVSAAAAPFCWAGALTACACLGCWAARASLSLRTTGASIVDDAERTNSPISWSRPITALLSTPNSLASSYTRTFATALPLIGPDIPDQSAGPGQRVLRPASACAVHRRMLIGRSLQSQPALCGTSCRACDVHARRGTTLRPASQKPCRPTGLARQLAARIGLLEIPGEPVIP